MKLIMLNRTITDHNGDAEHSVSALIQTEDKERVMVSVTPEHPRFNLISDLVSDYEKGLITNTDLAEKLYSSVQLVDALEAKLVTIDGILDGRMRLNGSRVTIDGDPVDSVLEEHIVRLLSADGTPRDESNWASFAKFVDNLYSNVSEHVREQLFRWLSYKGNAFTLTSEGMLIGYKGCAGTADDPVSIHHGPAIVDGVPVDGAVPNKIGSVVEIARSKVEFDPAVGCAPGLHVGSYEYASNWARGVILTVVVNPRDIVSVPTECDSQKIRTCRYTVLGAVTAPITDTTYYGDDEDDDWDYLGDDQDDPIFDGDVEDASWDGNIYELSPGARVTFLYA
jgi:hypothetical protein